jgi:hypothetical protein
MTQVTSVLDKKLLRYNFGRADVVAVVGTGQGPAAGPVKGLGGVGQQAPAWRERISAESPRQRRSKLNGF